MTEASTDTASISELIEELRERIGSELKGFSLPSDANPGVPDASRLGVPTRTLPVPRLAQWVLTWGLGAPDYGIDEKRAWLVRFRFQEHECSLGLYKFGLRLQVPLEKSDENGGKFVKSLLGRIDKAIRVAEGELLNEYAEQQVRQGNLTVDNQYGLLEGMYQHFRLELEKSEADTGTIQEGAQRGDSIQGFRDELFAGMTQAIDSEQYRFYASIAMVNAYFSMLEHLLVLLWPFTRYRPGEDDVEELIKDRWSEKFKKVFDIVDDHDAKRIYDRLRDIAERYRNTYAHGGFGKQRGALYVHFPDGPPIPASLSDSRNQLRTSLFPVADPDISEILAVLDETDAWLRSGSGALGMRYVETGINVAYDAKSVSETTKMMTDAAGFDAYLKGLSHSIDRATNMDW